MFLSRMHRIHTMFHPLIPKNSYNDKSKSLHSVGTVKLVVRVITSSQP
jgi:hypothetical protein